MTIGYNSHEAVEYLKVMYWMKYGVTVVYESIGLVLMKINEGENNGTAIGGSGGV